MSRGYEAIVSFEKKLHVQIAYVFIKLLYSPYIHILKKNKTNKHISHTNSAGMHSSVSQIT